MAKKQNFWSDLKGFAKSQQSKYIESIILAVLGVLSGLVPYLAATRIILKLLDGNKNETDYLVLCGVAATGYLLKVLFANWSTAVSHQATFQTLKEIRKSLITKLTKIPMGDILDTPSGQYKSIIVDRVEGLETTLAHLLPEMTANILAPIVMFFYLISIDYRMALVSLVTFPVGMIFMMGIAKTYPKQYAGSVKVSKRMNQAVVEYVNGIEVIKAFNQSAQSYKKYTDAVTDHADYFYQWMKSCQWPIASYTAICPATLVTVLPVGYIFFRNGSLTSGEFITIIIVSLSIIGPILAASNFVDNMASVGTIVGEITGILNAPELVRPEHSEAIEDLTIRLNDVSFSYHKKTEEFSLEDINLEIKPGTTTAFVGPSGSGKSTIAKLIAGFWDVSAGSVSIGGQDLKKISAKRLAESIAYVSQDNYLFDDSIRENIRMGRKGATDQQVEQAAAAAECDAFIRALEHGYDTRVGSAGGHLSGGERQRVAIARAMLKEAPIVILDEATAYIDPDNEALIQQAVAKLVAGKTLIVIAHRLSTITDSDQIVVVESGRIQAVGTHEQLLEKSTLYQDMWNAHLGAKDGESV